MDIKVPPFPESVDDGEISAWRKKEGESFSRDEVLVEIETDKVVLEIPAPQAGTLTKITVKEGATVKANQVIGAFSEGDAGDGGASKDDAADTSTGDAADEGKSSSAASANKAEVSASSPTSKSATKSALDSVEEKTQATSPVTKHNGGGTKAGPAARRLAQEKGVNLADIAKSGKGIKGGELVTKQDVAEFTSKSATSQSSQPQGIGQSAVANERVQKRVPMTRLRASIAKRLVESQQTAAMLTTFNEVNMAPIMELRSKYKKAFEEKHLGTRLGFMSFFVKGTVLALTKYPEVNAYIEGTDIVYHSYYDVGIAVSSPRGLVVPILRDAQLMTLVDIEQQINEYAAKAQDGKLMLEELQGGTFTISNGGVFGSLLSTPIINPPQTAILGMHKIQERPVAVKGKVEILPMMYLALSYDHRMIDGKTAVQFLSAIKDFLENPGLILLDL